LARELEWMLQGDAGAQVRRRHAPPPALLSFLNFWVCAAAPAPRALMGNK
jgi:hypothetical protein